MARLGYALPLTPMTIPVYYWQADHFLPHTFSYEGEYLLRMMMIVIMRMIVIIMMTIVMMKMMMIAMMIVMMRTRMTVMITLVRCGKIMLTPLVMM